MHWLNEGQRFTRRRLVTSLSSVSRLRIIYRVRLRDDVLRIDESDKPVDIEICFREKIIVLVGDNLKSSIDFL